MAKIELAEAEKRLWRTELEADEGTRQSLELTAQVLQLQSKMAYLQTKNERLSPEKEQLEAHVEAQEERMHDGIRDHLTLVERVKEAEAAFRTHGQRAYRMLCGV